MHLLRVITATLATCVVSGHAFGMAGSLERVFLYSAYLQQNIMGVVPTIAPSCGKDLGRICTFNEFLKYIWEPWPNVGETPADRPINDPVDRANINFQTANIQTITQALNMAHRRRNNPLRFPINNAVDGERLLPGSMDYPDAVRLIGHVTKAANDWLRANGCHDRAEEMRGLVARGKEAIMYAQDVRAREMDNNRVAPRIRSLETRLGLPLNSLPTIQGRDSSGKLGQYFVLDSARTIRETLGGNELRLNNAMREWSSDPANGYSNRSHKTMLMSVKLAAQYSGCGST